MTFDELNKSLKNPQAYNYPGYSTSDIKYIPRSRGNIKYPSLYLDGFLFNEAICVPLSPMQSSHSSQAAPFPILDESADEIKKSVN